jgi:hypothetical protein
MVGGLRVSDLQIIIRYIYKSREIETRLRDRLRAFRVVSLTEARQVGKATLVQRL